MLALSRLRLKLNNHKEYEQKTSKTKQHKKTFKKQTKAKKLLFYISTCE